MPAPPVVRGPGRQLIRDGQSTFAGGLNTVSDQLAIADNQVRRAENARLSEFGGMMKRLGSQRTHASALQSGAPVRGGYGWLKTDGTCEQLVVANGVLHTGTYGVPMTWTARTGALDAAAYPDFVEFVDAGVNEVVYVADGGAINRWNGTTFTIDVNPSITGIVGVTVFNRRLWGHSRTSLFYSALDNGDTLGVTASGGGQIIVRTFGQEEIRMLAVVGSSLLIGHPRGFSRLAGWGQSDITVQPVAFSADNGVVSRRAWCLVDGQLWFVSSRGLYRANEAQAVAVGSPATPDPLTPVLSQMSAAELERVVCVHHAQFYEIWVYLPDRGFYVYNYRLGAWTGPMTFGYTVPTTQSAWLTQDANQRPIVLVGDGSGWVKRMDATGVFRDNVSSNGTGGDPFAFAVRLRRLIFGDETTLKSLRRIWVYGDLRGSTTGTVRFSGNYGGGAGTIPGDPGATSWGRGTWGTGTWGATGAGSARINAWGQGNYIEVELADDGDSDAIYSRVLVEAHLMGQRAR